MVKILFLKILMLLLIIINLLPETKSGSLSSNLSYSLKEASLKKVKVPVWVLVHPGCKILQRKVWYYLLMGIPQNVGSNEKLPF